MNIILSRKGFDSTLAGGGHPNWIYQNKFYPVPIPENGTGVKYENVTFQKNISYLDVMLDLNIRQYTECHLDPNLGFKNINNDKFWEKCLGQIGPSNNSLKRCNVDTDSIFLFFGWFKNLEYVNDKFRYIKDSEDYPTGKHVIYGYLEVAKRLDGIEVNKFNNSQPHVKFNNDRYDESSNSIYTAKKTCSFKPEIEGAGLFEFSDKLILTEKYKTRSNWELPNEILNSINEETTYLYKMCKNQRVRENKIKFNTQGQEIIFENANINLVNWVKKLIKENHI